MNNKNTCFRFSGYWFLAFVVIFILEVIIALYVHDSFIRPYLGDVLVVVLLYCLAKAVLKVRSGYVIFAVLLFAYAVEITQYFQLVKIMNLHHIRWLRIIFGTVFSWGDMLCYTVGALLCYGIAILTTVRKNIIR